MSLIHFFVIAIAPTRFEGWRPLDGDQLTYRMENQSPRKTGIILSKIPEENNKVDVFFVVELRLVRRLLLISNLLT